MVWEVSVSGVTALFADIADLSNRRLPVFIATVIGLSFVMLFAILFGSSMDSEVFLLSRIARSTTAAVTTPPPSPTASRRPPG